MTMAHSCGTCLLRASLYAVLTMGIVTALRADIVYLRNGDRLSGEMLTGDQHEIQMKSDVAGTVRLRWDVVKRLTIDRPLYATLVDGQVVQGTFTVLATVVEFRGRRPERTIAWNKIRMVRSGDELLSYERMQKPRWFEQWTGSIAAGLSAAQGNTEVLTSTLNAKISRVAHRDRTMAYFTSLFNRGAPSNSDGEASAIRSGLRYDFNIAKHLFSFGFSDFEYDALQDLDFRNVIGGGIGWRLKKSSHTLFDVFSGSSFNQEYFSSASDRKTGELLVGEEVSRKFSERSELIQRLAVFPNLSDPGSLRMSFDLSTTTKLNHWLEWHVSMSDRWLSSPVPGVKKNDLLITTGVGVHFGEISPFESAFGFVKFLTHPEENSGD